MLESLGCEMSSMFYTSDGQTLTIGTAKGKKFLESHPAILSSFNTHFLYGMLKYNILMFSITLLTPCAAYFEKQQKCLTATGEALPVPPVANSVSVTTTSTASQDQPSSSGLQPSCHADKVLVLKKDGNVVASGNRRQFMAMNYMRDLWSYLLMM